MNQTLDLAALKAVLERHRNLRPMLGYHGLGIEIEADQLAALIEVAEERESLLEEVHLLQIEVDNWRHAAQHPETYTTTTTLADKAG